MTLFALETETSPQRVRGRTATDGTRSSFYSRGTRHAVGTAPASHGKYENFPCECVSSKRKPTILSTAYNFPLVVSRVLVFSSTVGE